MRLLFLNTLYRSREEKFKEVKKFSQGHATSEGRAGLSI